MITLLNEPDPVTEYIYFILLVHLNCYTGFGCSQFKIAFDKPDNKAVKSENLGDAAHYYCLKVNPPPKDVSLLDPPLVTLPSVTPVSKAQLPMSSFLAGPVGEISKSKISIGKPKVVHALERVSLWWGLGRVILTLVYQQYQLHVPGPGRRKVGDRLGSQSSQICGDTQCSGGSFVCKPL